MSCIEISPLDGCFLVTNQLSNYLMAASPKINYTRISEESNLEHYNGEDHCVGRRVGISMTINPAVCLLVVLLLVSVLFNAIFLSHVRDASSASSCKSIYGECCVLASTAQPIFNTGTANLDVGTYPREIYPHQEYIDEANLTATSLAWEALSGDPGVVALRNDFVFAKKLPTAMRYPWDASKGVYLLQGFHNLHCTVCYIAE